MSSSFIKEQRGSVAISIARRQQRQLKYLTQSSVQEDATVQYYENWAHRKFATDDYFKNWIKTILKEKNFISVFKFMRYPLPSAKLINDRIKPQLKRVFFSEDAYEKYTLRNKGISCPQELDAQKFSEQLFDALLFNHNDIIVCDLKDVNKPFRQFIPIDNVVSIESHCGIIEKICYAAQITTEGGETKSGYLYIDTQRYAFYENADDDTPILEEYHDLGVCPADYVSNERFGDLDPVRKSIFSYVIPDLEEYCFLKTLQKMQDANGTFPVTTKLKTTEKPRDGRAADALAGEPMSAAQSGKNTDNVKAGGIPYNESPLNPGTVFYPPMVVKGDGAVDMDVVTNFLKFFYIPVDILEFIDKRIKEVEKTIVSTVIGDFEEVNSTSKNELQVGKSYDNKQDKLRQVSMNMSQVRTSSDFKMLALQHGKEQVTAEVFFGSDFFLETQQDIFDLIKSSPNPIERKNLMVRLSQNKNRFNPEKKNRETLLYDIIPYSADVDFQTALDQKLVSNENKVLQTQFSYYIALFEAKYGDVLAFYNSLSSTPSEKLIAIKNLISGLVKEEMSRQGAEQVK